MKKALSIFALTLVATSFSFAEETAEETTATEEACESTYSETTTACGRCPIKK